MKPHEKFFNPKTFSLGNLKKFQPENVFISKPQKFLEFFIEKNYWLKIGVMILESVGPTVPDSHFTYI